MESVPVLCIKKWRTQKFKILKSSFNTFHSVGWFFLIHYFTYFLSIIFPIYILWIKIDELWQCLVLCLIQSQKRVKKHNCTWSLMQNQPRNIGNCHATYTKMKLCIQLYIDIWKIIQYLEANPYLLKIKNTNSLIFISIFIK